MSIYPVQLSTWFPYGDEKHDTALFIVSASRCLACGSRIKFTKAIGHHSLPWGHGDIWCSWKCCYSGKFARVDKRRNRRINRRLKELRLEHVTIVRSHGKKGRK